MKRRKKLVIILAVLGGLIVLQSILQHTFVLSFLRVPTTGNVPAFFPDDWITASRLKQAVPGRMVVFRAKNSSGKTEERMYRLVATAGQTVELRNGVAWVNGKLFDDSTKLAFAYTLKAPVIVMPDSLKPYTPVEVLPGTYFIQLTPKMAAGLGKYFDVQTMRHDPQLGDPNLAPPFRGKRWNADWFGPVTVPPGKVFLLGDSRNNALDSRYTGFAEAQDIVATVLGDH